MILSLIPCPLSAGQGGDSAGRESRVSASSEFSACEALCRIYSRNCQTSTASPAEPRGQIATRRPSATYYPGITSNAPSFTFTSESLICTLLLPRVRVMPEESSVTVF